MLALKSALRKLTRSHICEKRQKSRSGDKLGEKVVGSGGTSNKVAGSMTEAHHTCTECHKETAILYN